MNNNQNNADDVGIFQLDNGYWGYRYVIKSNGQRKDGRKWNFMRSGFPAFLRI